MRSAVYRSLNLFASALIFERCAIVRVFAPAVLPIVEKRSQCHYEFSNNFSQKFHIGLRSSTDENFYLRTAYARVIADLDLSNVQKPSHRQCCSRLYGQSHRIFQTVETSASRTHRIFSSRNLAKTISFSRLPISTCPNRRHEKIRWVWVWEIRWDWEGTMKCPFNLAYHCTHEA